MKKATFTIQGEGIHECILEAIADFQKDEYIVRYDFGTAILFMFDQYKCSIPNFALNVIVDFSLEPLKNDEIILQCIAMEGNNRHEIRLIDIEKSLLHDFRAHFFGYRERHNCPWEITEMIF